MVILPFWWRRARPGTSIQVLEQSVIDRAMERDAPAAKAEYLAEFRTDIEALLTQEAVGACVDAGILERPFNRQNNYVAFVDPSGGSSDAMTLAIAHKEGNTVVLDVIREHKPPFCRKRLSPSTPNLIRKYRCSQAYRRSVRRRMGCGTIPQTLRPLRGIGTPQVGTVSRHAASNK